MWAHVKPELTFRRSLRLIMKRWWLMALCGVLVAAVAVVVTHGKKGHYDATTTLTMADVTVQNSQFGPGLAVVSANPKFTDDWVTDDFLNLAAAQTASKLLGGSPSANTILNNVIVTPLSANSVQLDYAAGGDRGRSDRCAAQVLDRLHQPAGAGPEEDDLGCDQSAERADPHAEGESIAIPSNSRPARCP